MARELKTLAVNGLYNYVKENQSDLSIYIWVDVWKTVLDVGATVNDGWIQTYLWTIYNSANGFKQVENLIINLILMWIDENKIFFGTENTGIYWHDIMNYFDDRLPNTYLLNSSLTFHARKFYAKSDYKSDDIDSIVIANTMKDLDNKTGDIYNSYLSNMTEDYTKGNSCAKIVVDFMAGMTDNYFVRQFEKNFMPGKN